MEQTTQLNHKRNVIRCWEWRREPDSAAPRSHRPTTHHRLLSRSHDFVFIEGVVLISAVRRNERGEHFSCPLVRNGLFLADLDDIHELRHFYAINGGTVPFFAVSGLEWAFHSFAFDPMGPV